MQHFDKAVKGPSLYRKKQFSLFGPKGSVVMYARAVQVIARATMCLKKFRKSKELSPSGVFKKANVNVCQSLFSFLNSLLFCFNAFRREEFYVFPTTLLLCRVVGYWLMKLFQCS